jgi:hypothetical protein
VRAVTAATLRAWVALPEPARALVRSGVLAHCTTLNADGSPQLGRSSSATS